MPKACAALLVLLACAASMSCMDVEATVIVGATGSTSVHLEYGIPAASYPCFAQDPMAAGILVPVDRADAERRAAAVGARLTGHSVAAEYGKRVLTVDLSFPSIAAAAAFFDPEGKRITAKRGAQSAISLTLAPGSKETMDVLSSFFALSDPDDSFVLSIRTPTPILSSSPVKAVGRANELRFEAKAAEAMASATPIVWTIVW